MKTKTKKASITFTDILFGIVLAASLGLITAYVLWVCGVNLSEATRIPLNVEDEIAIAPRFYNSEKCFAYIDENNKLHPKLVDTTKFNQDILDTICFPKSEVIYSFKLRVEQDFEGIGPKLVFGPIKTHNWIDLGYESKRIVEKVHFLYAGKIYDGKIIIDVKNVK